jgi:hypothetical protein
MAELNKIFFDISEDDVVTSEEYIGELPPARQAIEGVISRIYLDKTAAGDPIFKVLYTATEERYAGFTAWDNVTLTKKASFKWSPLIEALGVTVGDLAHATDTDNDDKSGAGVRVVRIGALNLSKKNTVPVRFGVKYRKYDGVIQTDVATVRPRTISEDS